jgi:hypothetical protein
VCKVKTGKVAAFNEQGMRLRSVEVVGNSAGLGFSPQTLKIPFFISVDYNMQKMCSPVSKPGGVNLLLDQLDLFSNQIPHFLPPVPLSVKWLP